MPSDQPDLDLTNNNAAQRTTVVEPAANLSVAGADSSARAFLGTTLTYMPTGARSGPRMVTVRPLLTSYSRKLDSMTAGGCATTRCHMPSLGHLNFPLTADTQLGSDANLPLVPFWQVRNVADEA